MPGEFVISPRDVFSSQPIGFHRSHAQAQASKDNAAKEIDVEQQRRPSLETLDSIAEQKQSLESSNPRSGFRSVLDKARRKLSSSGNDKQVLAGSEEEHERQKQLEIEFRRRQEEAQKFQLKDKVNYMNING